MTLQKRIVLSRKIREQRPYLSRKGELPRKGPNPKTAIVLQNLAFHWTGYLSRVALVYKKVNRNGAKLRGNLFFCAQEKFKKTVFSSTPFQGLRRKIMVHLKGIHTLGGMKETRS